MMRFWFRLAGWLMCPWGVAGIGWAQGWNARIVPDGLGMHPRQQWSLPDRQATPAGFTMTIESADPAMSGYLPLRLVVTATGRFTAERQLEVYFEPVGQRTNAATVIVPITLQQGGGEHRQDIYLPHYQARCEYQVRVSENNRHLPGYETYLARPAPSAEASPQRHRIMLLLPAEAFQSQSVSGWRKPPDVGSLMLAINHRYATGTTRESEIANLQAWVERDSDPLRILQNSFPLIAAVRSSDQMWDDWRGYEAYNIILMPLPLFLETAKQQPARSTAIRHFVAAGGTLWFYAVDDPAEAEKAFSLQPETSAEAETRAEYLRRFGGGVSMSSLPAGVQVRDYLAGQVVILPGETPFPGAPTQWETLLQLQPMNTNTVVRRGVDPINGDGRFWEWVLANVAVPPIYGLLTLLGGFAILVGPVAYRFSTLMKRTYLMLVIGPVLAIATTVAMAIYSVTADGLGTKARMRQVTWVDSGRGTGLQWQRTTYFSGIAGSDSMAFPVHAAVFPYRPAVGTGRQFRGQANRNARIRLADDSQQFVLGFLPSRTQSQFVTLQPSDQLRGLKMLTTQTRADSGAPELQNRFSFAVREVLVRDLDDNYWMAEKIAAGQATPLQPIERVDFSSALRVRYLDTAPALPPGFQRRRLIAAANQTSDVVAMSTLQLPSSFRNATEGMIEEYLRFWLNLEGTLPPGHFCALGEIKADVLALPGARTFDSIHFCIGKYE